MPNCIANIKSHLIVFAGKVPYSKRSNNWLFNFREEGVYLTMGILMTTTSILALLPGRASCVVTDQVCNLKNYYALLLQAWWVIK